MRNKAAESILDFHIPTLRHEENIEDGTASTLDFKPALPGVVIGRLASFENGQARVDFPDNPHSGNIAAQTGVPLSVGDIGREVILAFANGDPGMPVILSLLANSEADGAHPSSLDIQVDGERLLVNVQREIVLRCGEACITLTAAGKVLIKGNYVLSQSTGYNKIKGAAVGIN